MRTRHRNHHEPPEWKSLLIANLAAACCLTAQAAEPVHQGAMTPVRLRCEYQEAPLGVDLAKPRLNWQFQPAGAQQRGLKQTAFQILAASSEAAIQKDQGDLWDSGRGAADESVHIEYAGRRLASRSQNFWKVRVWDQAGRGSAWSVPATCCTTWSFRTRAPGTPTS